MSAHQSRKFGCHRSRARWSLRSPARSTLLGIFESKSIFGRALVISHSLLVEVGLAAGAVLAQRAVGAARVGPNEDPVLPGRESAENPGLHGLGADEPVVGLHAGEGVGAQRGPLLEQDPDLVGPVDVVGGVGDEAQVVGVAGEELLAALVPEGFERLVVAVAR